MSEQRSVGLLILHHVLFIPVAIIFSFFFGVILRTVPHDEILSDDEPSSFLEFLLCVISQNVILNWSLFLVTVLSITGLPGLENLMPENLGLAEGVTILCFWALQCFVQTTLHYIEKKKRTQKSPLCGDHNQNEGASAVVKTSVLERKMWNIAETVYRIAFHSMTLLVAIWLCIFSVDNRNNKQWGARNVFLCAYIMTVKYVLPALVFMMAALPYSPLNAVKITLNYLLHKKMVKNKLRVRHLDACEKMGYVTEICCNKPGILTTNRQHVAAVFIAGQYYQMPQLNQIPQNTMALLLLGIGVNCSYTSYIVPAEERGGLSQQVGNKMECALLSFANNLGGDYSSIRCQIPEKDLFKVYPFTREKKSMSTVLKKDGSYKMFSKGDCETLLHKCSTYLSSNGTEKSFNTQSKEALLRTVVEPMKSKGLKTLCLAYKDFLPAENPNWNNEDQIVCGLTLICVVGIEDPVKPEVPDAIRRCQEAGITVRMMTGGNIHTAKAIAMKCGIITSSEDICLEGRWLSKRNSYSPGENAPGFKISPKLKVIATASTKDKLNLIEAEGAPGTEKRVIAVIGHRQTDAQALKRADVGISMGITGSEEAREASDIVLMEDSFSDIVHTVLWGRNVRVAACKIVQYFATAFTVALLTLFTGVFISKDPVLNTMDLLWVVIILELVPVAMANDPPSESLLHRRPYKMDEPLLSVEMVRDIIGQTAYQIICIILCRLLLSRPGNTIVFNMYILLQIFNMFNVRTLGAHANVVRGLHKNPIFFSVLLAIFSFQVIIVQFGFLFYHHVPLNLLEWLFCIVLSICSLIWEQLLVHIHHKWLKALGLHPVDFPQWEAAE